jgi:hypothetical protein
MPACLGVQAPVGPAVCGAGGSPLQEEVIDELLQARECGTQQAAMDALQRQALYSTEIAASTPVQCSPPSLSAAVQPLDCTAAHATQQPVAPTT